LPSGSGYMRIKDIFQSISTIFSLPKPWLKNSKPKLQIFWTRGYLLNLWDLTH
jgi:hypothetical protein